MDPDEGCYAGIRLARDQYSTTPGFPDTHSSADFRAPVKHLVATSTSSSAIKRKGTSQTNKPTTNKTQPPHPHPQPNKSTRFHLPTPPLNPLIDLHQSTCLNLNPTNTTTPTSDSDLWILPDFEDWHLDYSATHLSPPTANAITAIATTTTTTTTTTTIAPPPRRKEGEWAPIVSRAVNSNRERLRRRLEGDGWDFVCGRYGEDGRMLRELAWDGADGRERDREREKEKEESVHVDEEFDVVVVLPGLLRVVC